MPRDSLQVAVQGGRALAESIVISELQRWNSEYVEAKGTRSLRT